MERKINGTCILPDNGFYALAYVPRNATVEGSKGDPIISSSTLSPVSRAITATGQIIYTSFTLYKATKGPQISHYGFTAFGLTASP